MTTDSPTRLNKLLAETLGLSRREADQAIEAGQVTVNGVTAQLGGRAQASDMIVFRGRPVQAATHVNRYLVLNKPVGYVCSRKQQGEAATIYSLLPPEYASLKTVGRLDRDSSGLLILTDDGDLAHRLTHPKFVKTKRYEVTLDQPLAPLHQQMISDHGVLLPDGRSRFTISSLEAARYEVVMHEGRNRQIRRTFAALGYQVTALHRTDFGPYRLHDLAPGSYQLLAGPLG